MIYSTLIISTASNSYIRESLRERFRVEPEFEFGK